MFDRVVNTSLQYISVYEPNKISFLHILLCVYSNIRKNKYCEYIDVLIVCWM